MNPALFVQAAYHELLPQREPTREPRERFVRYQADLHRIAGTALDPASLTLGDQYTFVDLADTLLERVGKPALANLDVLVTSYWTPEFDPDISAFGPYLHHRYALDCPSFDLIDQGSISPLLALLVLGDYLRGSSTARDGALLAVEQSTVPQALGAHFPGPESSTAGLLRVSRRDSGAAAEILAAKSFNETRIVDPDFDLCQLAAAWCQEFALEPDEVTITIRRDSFLYRKWAFQDVDGLGLQRMRFLPPVRSCTTVFGWLATVLADPEKESRYVIFLDEDVESLAAAAVLVRLGGLS